jgi:hypothetical protein
MIATTPARTSDKQNIGAKSPWSIKFFFESFSARSANLSFAMFSCNPPRLVLSAAVRATWCVKMEYKTAMPTSLSNPARNMATRAEEIGTL